MKNKQSFMIAVILASNSLLSFSQRTYPVPEYMGFSIAEDAMHTDTMYLYNPGAQAYLCQGNAWGTQAMMDDTGLQVCFSKHVTGPDSIWDGKTYEINDFCMERKEHVWKRFFIDKDLDVYVDHGKQGGNCWLFQIEENDDGTFRIYGADSSVYSHANYPDTYLGVPERKERLYYFDYYIPGESQDRPCRYENVSLLNPSQLDTSKFVAFHLDWVFVTKDEFERQKGKVEIYNLSLQLLYELWQSNLAGIDNTDEQKVYDNPESTLEDIKNAINSLVNRYPEAPGGWSYPEPVTTGFQIAGDAYCTDTMYLYNVGAQAYFTEGNSWGTQASVGDSGLKVYIEKHIEDPEETDWDGKTYLIWDYSLTRNMWMNLFIDSETEMYVDHGSQGNYCWLFEIVDNGNGTFKIHAADDSKYSHTNYPGTYIGVVEYAGGTMANTISPLLNPDEMDKTKYEAFHTDWAFVSKADYEAHQKKLKAYRASQELLAALEKAKALGIDVAAEQAVYDNTGSNIETMNGAVVSLKEKTALYYETAITPSSPMSMDEEYVINTTFETSDHWVTTTGAQETGTKTGGWATMKGRDGEYHLTGSYWVNMSTNSFTGKMYRQMEYMPKGVYSLQLAAFDAFRGNEDLFRLPWNLDIGAYVFINHADSTLVEYYYPETYEVLAIVDDNTVEVGLSMGIDPRDHGSFTNLVGMDNCHLIYYGCSPESFAYAFDRLKENVTLTDTTLCQKSMRAEYEALMAEFVAPDNLEEAITSYKTVREMQRTLLRNIKDYRLLQDNLDFMARQIKSAEEYDFYIEMNREEAYLRCLELVEECKVILAEQNLGNEELEAKWDECYGYANSLTKIIKILETEIKAPEMGTETDDNLNHAAIYTLQGIKTTTPSKGVHIIRYSDGTTKKVYTR